MTSAMELTEAQVRALYERQGLSVAEIAARLGCPASSLRTLMRRWGIRSRSRSEAMRLKRARTPERQVHIPRLELEQLYREDGLSAEAIAERFQCSPGTIRNQLRQNGIARFPPGRRRVEVTPATLDELYLHQQFSMREVARELGCDAATIRNKLRAWGFRVRSYAEANQIYPKYDFAGGLAEKAYLIGFRLGDLHVHKLGAAGQTIVVECSSSQIEQLGLIRELFGPYGHVYESTRLKKDGNRSIACYLNESFAFLLPKIDAAPDEIDGHEAAQAAFAAGYLDAEGSFHLGRGLGHFAVSSYDVGIIHWLNQWMTRHGVVCPLPRCVGRAGQARPSGAVFRKDLWTLNVNRKASLLRLIELLEPFLRHAKRRRDMETVRHNILERNARRRPADKGA